MALAVVGVASAARRRLLPEVLPCAGAALLVAGSYLLLQTVGEGRELQIRAAAALRPVVQDRPCLVVRREKQATADHLGCRVVGAHPTARPPRRVREAERAGRVVVAVLPGRPPEGYPQLLGAARGPGDAGPLAGPPPTPVSTDTRHTIVR